MEGIPLNLNYKVPIKGYEKFWESLKEGQVWGTSCTKCGEKYFPPQLHCSKCGASTTWFKVSEEGELLTYSIVKAKPQGFEGYEDYTIALVRTKEVDLMCWLSGEPRVGAQVRIGADGRRVTCLIK
jgi:Predicted nucleic-acid-binding protein containing a Zn-ribbon